MKNPLVDALRQASDSVIEPVKQPEAPPLQSSTASAELALLDTLVLDPATTTANEELDADFYATTGLQIDDDMHIVRDAGAGPVPRRTSARRSGNSGLPRLGLYSPLLSLALLAVSAAAYFAYHELAGRYQNADLQALSAQVDVTRPADDSDAPHSARYANPFALIKGPQPRAASGAESQPATPRPAGKDKQASPEQESRSVTAMPDRALALLNDAYRQFTAGELAAAESNYREALTLAPRHPNALHGLAAVLQRNGKAVESMQVFETLLSVEPNNAAAAAALLMQADGAAAADSEIRYLLQRHPGSASLNFALAVVLAEQERWVDAGHYFGQAVQLDKANADYLFNYAVSLEQLGKFDAARHYYEAALQASDASSAVESEMLAMRIAELSR